MGTGTASLLSASVVCVFCFVSRQKTQSRKDVHLLCSGIDVQKGKAQREAMAIPRGNQKDNRHEES